MFADKRAAHINTGVEFFNRGDLETAERHFRAAFRVAPWDGLTLYNVGRVLEERKNPEAEDFYHAAIAVGYNEAHYSLGCLLTEQSRKEEALLHYSAFIKAVPEDSYVAQAKEAMRKLSPLQLVPKK